MRDLFMFLNPYCLRLRFCVLSFLSIFSDFLSWLTPKLQFLNYKIDQTPILPNCQVPNNVNWRAKDRATIQFWILWPKVTVHKHQISPSQTVWKTLGVPLTQACSYSWLCGKLFTIARLLAVVLFCFIFFCGRKSQKIERKCETQNSSGGVFNFLCVYKNYQYIMCFFST